MRKIIVIFMLLIFSVLSFSQPKIVFINPGKSDERFWVMVSDFMKASAVDLELELEVLYAERNFLKAVSILKELSQRVKKPDYVVIVNEKLVAPRLFRIAEENNINTFLILNDLNLEQTEAEGTPRSKNRNWLGSLIPNNIDAGYMIADSLIKSAKKIKGKELSLVAIAGNRATPASVYRVEGLKKALEENESVKLHQIFYAEWDEQKSYSITGEFLDRHKEVDIIWAVNDPIAIGALRAMEERGFKAGTDIVVGGLNWSPEGLRKVQSGEMVCTVGGHFMIGGWALVLIKDYSHGIDFATEDGNVELKVNVFGLIDSSNVHNYIKYLGDSDWDKIDFKQFSKYYNKDIDNYDFSLDKILEQF